jgi:uncharacterized membrane protein YtjA (UPF0391 family)
VLLRTFGAGTVFLVIALVAALFGFGVVSDDDPLAAKLCAGFFLLAAVAAFGWGWMNRSRQVVSRVPLRASRPPVGDEVRRGGVEWVAP